VITDEVDVAIVSRSTGNGSVPASVSGRLLRPTSFRKVGQLVAVEGPDGSGKTTVMERIRSQRTAAGGDVLLSNWHDAAYVYNLSQQLTLEGELEPYVRLVLGAAELAARYQYEILPTLERGGLAIVNKYLVSAMAHSRIRGHSVEFVRKVYRFALPPDCLIYFDVDPAVALARKGRAGVPGFWESGLDLATDVPIHEAMRRYVTGEMDPTWVRNRFQAFQTELRSLQWEEMGNWPNVVVIDANQALDDVVRAAQRTIAEIVDQKAEEDNHATT
jgi:dTMP kinase